MTSYNILSRTMVRVKLANHQFCPANVRLLGTAVSAETNPELLPRLPVPPLQQTLGKYLLSVRPLVTNEEFAQTEKLVKEFGSSTGLGEKLQFLLEERGRTTRNWLADWWLKTAYLAFRSPVVVHSSPGLVFPLQSFETKEDQLQFAAKMIAGALDYKRLIDEKRIPAETLGGKPVDMSQYNKVFSTCRIPGETLDSLIHYDSHGSNAPHHITVAHNNHFFKLTVYGQNRKVLSEDQIMEQLQDIVAQSREHTFPVGLLTTENRDVWGKAYKLLSQDSQNTNSLQDVQSGIFFLAIDGPSPDLGAPNRKTMAALQMIHGCGSSANGGNRWFDKTIQFVVGATGEVGLTYEHSPAEGPPIANLMDHVVDYISKDQTRSNGRASIVQQPKRLEFNVGQETQDTIKRAAQHLDSMVQDLEMSCFTFDAYGKQFIKSHKLSPDSFIQAAIQLAFYRIHGKPGACYESASTRQFVDGRTETIRSTSVESAEFCRLMLSDKQPAAARVDALRKAIDVHKTYARDAVSGHGVDRHLLGLKLIALDNGIEVPPIFRDLSYSRSTHFRISTSQVAAKCDGFMCYGPLVGNGYACCYNPRPNGVNFGISAFNSSRDTASGRFQDALECSLADMRDLLVLTSQHAKL